MEAIARMSPVFGSVTIMVAFTPSGMALKAVFCSAPSMVSSTEAPSDFLPVNIASKRS
ncbi:hypothetical protein D3C74_438910 [compost metagenome]